jgi:sporulation protein YabP
VRNVGDKMNQYNETNNLKGNGQEHDVIMRGRRLLDITGVKQVESFDNEEFLLETVMGILAIRGQNLQMKNLDVDKGIVSIKGKVFDLVYLDEHHGEKAKGFFSKLFR